MNYRFRKLKRGTLARLALLSSRFDRMFKTGAPLLLMAYSGGASSRNLIVFLPGIGDLAEDFERSGFIADLRHHGITADAVAVDAHYGYYSSRIIHARIAEDVVASAHEAGYERIWLAGISLGGLGALSFTALHPAQISGLLLLAPYLGNGKLVNEIAAAGGVEQWEPGHIQEGDYLCSLWSWLKRDYAEGQARVPIYLGYGRSDAFARANALLATLLPSTHVYSRPGGHDWRTWKKLWREMVAGSKESLDAAHSPKSSSPVSGNMAS
ncbi:alpha/beta fold hydrolase [Noviherbaspirillum massiliense]|uniref:alpha/beta fold hydrolase n=1 Tax=Noviherbaspirillum massiliense TaxID=1465823 RepID=UPI0011DCF9C9|nr:alpha/beta fold hydrolase [Noviherbaspirillum massiliense]